MNPTPKGKSPANKTPSPTIKKRKDKCPGANTKFHRDEEVVGSRGPGSGHDTLYIINNI